MIRYVKWANDVFSIKMATIVLQISRFSEALCDKYRLEADGSATSLSFEYNLVLIFSMCAEFYNLAEEKNDISVKPLYADHSWD